MTRLRPPRTRLRRALFRAPILLYRLGLGWLLQALGQEVDGSEAAYRRVGPDREHGLPLVARTLGPEGPR